RQMSERQTWSPCAPAHTESHQRSALPCAGPPPRGTPAETPPSIHKFRLRQKSAPAQSRKYCRSPPPASLPHRSAQQRSHLRASAQIPCDASPARSARAHRTSARDTTPPAPPAATSPRRPRDVLPAAPACSTPQSPRSPSSEKTRGTFLRKCRRRACTTSPPARPDTRGNKGWRRESAWPPVPESSSRSGDARAPARSPPAPTRNRDNACHPGRKETRPSLASTRLDSERKF